MTWCATHLFTAAERSLTPIASIVARHWVHGHFANFGTGFLLGSSIALLILGVLRPWKGI
jgi:hypothetical protein